MAFLIILLVLFIDRVLWDGTRYRQHHWFSDYRHRLQQLPWIGQALDHAWGAVLLVGLPVALAGWLQWSLLPHLGSLFVFAFDLVILLLGLGPQELGRSVDAYLACRANQDLGEAQRLAHELGVHNPHPEATEVAHAVLVAACRRLTGPLIWFLAFGASGVVLYRLAWRLHWELEHSDRQFPLRLGAANLVRLLDWVPVRLTAAGYAIAGNFNAVASAWKRCSQIPGACPDDQALLRAAGSAALDSGGDNNESTLLEDSQALVWRSLTLWLILIGAITLFSL